MTIEFVQLITQLAIDCARLIKGPDDFEKYTEQNSQFAQQIVQYFKLYNAEAAQLNPEKFPNIMWQAYWLFDLYMRKNHPEGINLQYSVLNCLQEQPLDHLKANTIHIERASKSLGEISEPNAGEFIENYIFKCDLSRHVIKLESEKLAAACINPNAAKQEMNRLKNEIINILTTGIDINSFCISALQRCFLYACEQYLMRAGISIRHMFSNKDASAIEDLHSQYMQYIHRLASQNFDFLPQGAEILSIMEYNTCSLCAQYIDMLFASHAENICDETKIKMVKKAMIKISKIDLPSGWVENILKVVESFDEFINLILLKLRYDGKTYAQSELISRINCFNELLYCVAGGMLNQVLRAKLILEQQFIDKMVSEHNVSALLEYHLIIQKCTGDVVSSRNWSDNHKRKEYDDRLLGLVESALEVLKPSLKNSTANNEKEAPALFPHYARVMLS